MAQVRNWKAKAFVAHYNALYEIPAAQARGYLAKLRLSPHDIFIDLGCGNGGMLALVAPKVRRAVGVDCSPHQVRLARERLRHTANVEIVQAQFFNFHACGEIFTKAFSRKALHHLTDPQKEAFLARIAPSFAPGAIFLLEDGMFPFARIQLKSRMPQIMREAEVYFGAKWNVKKDDFLHSLREEFPASSEFWVAAFKKAGFRTVKRWQKTCFYGGLLTRKEI